MHYSLHNHYASETDVGLANTYYVLAWRDRASRDAYVSAQTDRCSAPVRRRDIGKYLSRPKPFSGEAFRLVADGWDEPGFVGEVQTSSWADLPRLADA